MHLFSNWWGSVHLICDYSLFSLLFSSRFAVKLMSNYSLLFVIFVLIFKLVCRKTHVRLFVIVRYCSFFCRSFSSAFTTKRAPDYSFMSVHSVVVFLRASSFLRPQLPKRKNECWISIATEGNGLPLSLWAPLASCVLDSVSGSSLGRLALLAGPLQ